MPDISMCSGEGCPMREQCYRYTAKPSEWQSYFGRPPIKEDGTCDYFARDDRSRQTSALEEREKREEEFQAEHARWHSEAATKARLKEMVEKGLIKESEVPEDVVSKMAKDLADDVDRKFVQEVVAVAVATPACDHGLAFDSEAAHGLDAHEVRKRWPRLDGLCPKGCGFHGIGYVSYEHYICGDW